MSVYDVESAENPRITFFVWLVLGATAVLLIGLGWHQLVAGRTYRTIEKEQTQRRIMRPGPRGDIYDRSGQLLVGNRPSFSAVIYLDDIRRDFRETYAEVLRAERQRIAGEYESIPEAERPPDPPIPEYQRLAWDARLEVVQGYLDQVNAITGREDRFDREKLIRHFNEQLLLPLQLGEELKAEEYALLVEQLPVNSPVKVYTDTARYYPEKDLAAHVLGYVRNEDPQIDEIPDDGLKTFTFKVKRGQSGLEKAFEEHLMGTTGIEIWRVDPLGFQHEQLEQIVPRKGKDLITSLDLEMQRAAETALGDRTGAAVALDVQTGEVLVLASRPGYDLNELSPFISTETFARINEAGAWLNRSLQLSYPPGSTFKIITSIAGMLHGTMPEQTVHDCQGVHRVGRRVFRCHARYGHGEVNLQEAIEKSCNVFYYREGLEMGIDVLSAMATRFGLAERTGIQVPFETARLVVPSKEWKRERGLGGWVPGDTANTAIGQGFLLVTPLQMACFTASLARGETRTKPSILALTSDEARKVDHGGEAIGLSPAQYARLFEGMERVTGLDGTGRLVAIEGMRIAGKTGTADFRAHGEEVNLAWFIGFAPVEDPRIAVAIMVEGTESSHAYHGGSTAGPIAKDIFMKYAERYPTQFETTRR